jgi:hypothetical protein
MMACSAEPPEADRIGCAPIKTLCAFAMKLRAAALRIRSSRICSRDAISASVFLSILSL